MKTIEHVTAQAWYQHWWTDNLRTSLDYGIGWWGYGGIPRAVDTGAVGTSQISKLQTAYINLIWSPVKSVISASSSCTATSTSAAWAALSDRAAPRSAAATRARTGASWRACKYLF